MGKKTDMINKKLEQYSRNSSRDISKSAQNVDCTVMKSPIHKIQVQKAVILFNVERRLLMLRATRVGAKTDPQARLFLVQEMLVYTRSSVS